jgi:hypothetical protein
MMAGLPKLVHILGGYFVIAATKEVDLDEEWVDLIKEALILGISADEIRDFLNKI